jgi:hypothetical protein
VLGKKAFEAEFTSPRGDSIVVEDELVECAFAMDSATEPEAPVLDWAFGTEGHQDQGLM